jgi:hypothetical protein
MLLAVVQPVRHDLAHAGRLLHPTFMRNAVQVAIRCIIHPKHDLLGELASGADYDWREGACEFSRRSIMEVPPCGFFFVALEGRNGAAPQ